MSKIGVQVVPALVVFHTFPELAATYQVLRSVGSIAMSAMRPEAVAGPMLRQRKEERRPAFSSAGPSSSPPAPPPRCWAGRAAGAARGASRIVASRVRVIVPRRGVRVRWSCIVVPDGMVMVAVRSQSTALGGLGPHGVGPRVPFEHRFVPARFCGTSLSRLLVKVEAGEEILIARSGKPVARLVAHRNNRPVRRFGALKGRITVDDGFFDPLPESELAAWEG